MNAGDGTAPTPLAPSVEKAYYRKCIQLKRRLNEIESSNDEAKIRRARLDRGIMKMRLERAFLLDELRKRMEHNVDGSDGSGDETMATPPPDRPYRDKRRRQQSSTQAPNNTFQPGYAASDVPYVQSPNGQLASANAVLEDGRSVYVAPQEPAASLPVPPAVPSSHAPAAQHGSPYGPPPTGVPGSASVRQSNGVLHGANDREEQSDRKSVISSAGGVSDQRENGSSAFTAVNQ